MKLKNTPDVKLGVVAVSRDCFPIDLSKARLKNVVAECKMLKLKIIPCKTITESEANAMAAAAEMRAAPAASTCSRRPRTSSSER